MIFVPSEGKASPVKLTLYLGLCALITVGSLRSKQVWNAAIAAQTAAAIEKQALPAEAAAQPNAFAGTQSPPAEGTVAYAIARYGYSADEIRDDVLLVGLPQFLRKAGVTAKIDDRATNELIMYLTYRDKPFGRYIVKLTRIDSDRTKLFVGFVADDDAVVNALAAPLDTDLRPVDLFRTVLAEEIRGKVDLEPFDMSVLKSSGFKMWMINKGSDSRFNRDDNFELGYREKEEAEIRRAYRNEAMGISR